MSESVILDIRRELIREKILNNHARLCAIKNTNPTDTEMAFRLNDMIGGVLAEGDKLYVEYKSLWSLT